MIAFLVCIGCSFVLLIVVAGVLSCSLLARLYVPEGEPMLGSIAPDARLVVTAEVVSVYVEPDDTAHVVGSFSNGVQVRAMGRTRQNGCACGVSIQCYRAGCAEQILWSCGGRIVRVGALFGAETMRRHI
jgi:hypothetical protein